MSYLVVSAHWLVRFALGGVFTVSGLAKIRQPYQFLADVYAYRLVDPNLGLIVATTLPWIELIVGLSLIVGFLSRGAMLAAGLMLVLFVWVQYQGVSEGIDTSCGCWGGLWDDRINYTTLARTSTLAVLAVAGVVLGEYLRRTRAISPCSKRCHRQAATPSRFE
jgi:uncharacterized membrane protein YphA (DoxX/SURF4 family)